MVQEGPAGSLKFETELLKMRYPTAVLFGEYWGIHDSYGPCVQIIFCDEHIYQLIKKP